MNNIAHVTQVGIIEERCLSYMEIQIYISQNENLHIPPSSSDMLSNMPL